MNPCLWPFVEYGKRHLLPAVAGVYCVISSGGGMLYIGQSENIYQRWRGHHLKHLFAERRMTRIESVLVKGYQETTSSINALIESQEGMIQAQHRTDERLRETDERLNIFINVVERTLSSGTGKPKTARKQAGKRASKKGGRK